MSDTIVLDLRVMPPFERHAKIFETWGSLASGGKIQIIKIFISSIASLVVLIFFTA